MEEGWRLELEPSPLSASFAKVMYIFLARRLLRGLVVALVAATLAFGLLHLSGDPTDVLVPPDAPKEYIAQIRETMGLDKPLWVQYLTFIGNVARGDFGHSFTHRRPALDVILGYLPATYELLVTSLVLAVAVALPLGVMAGARPASRWQRLSRILELVGQAIPGFWLGIVLILVFAVQFPLLPVSGRGTPAHLVLPALVLASFVWPVLLRITRTSVAEVLSRDFVRTARAKGADEYSVITRHVLPNALVPIIAVGAFQVGILIGGAVVTETVFSWPGVGRAMVRAISARDFQVVQAGVILFAFQMILVNLAADLWHATLDPRIRPR